MARATGWYSNSVAILKIGLPLIALALLAGLFFVQTEDNFGGELVFSRGDLEALGEGLQVANPILTGTTEDGDRFQFTADLVTPDSVPPEYATLTNLSGIIDFTTSAQLRVSADSGTIDLKTRLLNLEGRIEIQDSSGYIVSSERMEVNLAAGSIESDATVYGEGPLGHISAGTMRIEPTAADPAKRYFSFSEGVQLLYNPI